MDTNELLAQLPLSDHYEDIVGKTLHSAEYRLVLIVKIIETLSKKPSSIEEAAMLFHEAKPLASMFMEASVKVKNNKQ